MVSLASGPKYFPVVGLAWGTEEVMGNFAYTFTSGTMGTSRLMRSGMHAEFIVAIDLADCFCLCFACKCDREDIGRGVRTAT